MTSLPPLPSGSMMLLFVFIMTLVTLYASWSESHSNK